MRQLTSKIISLKLSTGLRTALAESVYLTKRNLDVLQEKREIKKVDFLWEEHKCRLFQDLKART